MVDAVHLQSSVTAVSEPEKKKRPSYSACGVVCETCCDTDPAGPAYRKQTNNSRNGNLFIHQF